MMSPAEQRPELSVVVLTQGDRRTELDRALASVTDSLPTGRVEIVVVWNGVSSDGVDRPVVNLELPENLGIPEGRNAGMAVATSDLVFFLDDDAYLNDPTALAGALQRFDDDATLGVVSLRIDDEHGVTASRHTPRLGGRSADRSGPVTQFLGGASIHRRAAFEAVGGYAGAFFYAMEETDLALRVIDHGSSIYYDASLSLFHPRVAPSRHVAGAERTARNRVWLAHRNLPLPIAVVYVMNWLLISSMRNLGDRASLAAIIRGTREGLRAPLGPRQPIRWQTVWRLSRLGRPPIL